MTFTIIQSKRFLISKISDKSLKCRFFTEKEFLNYLSVIHNIRDKALFSFLYIMGTRKGEALSLQWKDIDLKNKTLKIYKTVTKDTNGAKHIKSQHLKQIIVIGS